MNWIDIEEVKYIINFMKDCYDLSLLNKGYSGDIKYSFFIKDKKYLIRFNKLDQIDRAIPNLTKEKKLPIIVDYMNRAYENSIKCPRVYDYGILHSYKATYIITSFIEGNIAEEELHHLDKDEQYLVGLELGRDLKKLHQLQFSIPKIDWLKENLDPYDKKMIKYINVKDQIKIKIDQSIETTLTNYIYDHKYLLKDREIKLIHNDIHLDNIVLNNGKYAGLIDFNELRYGDPYFEHKYLRLTEVYKFPSFCKGIVDGYFDKNIPELFWKLTYLYNALSIMTYLPLPDYFTEEEIKEEIGYNVKNYEAYGKYQYIIPKWYLKV